MDFFWLETKLALYVITISRVNNKSIQIEKKKITKYFETKRNNLSEK